MPAIEIYTCSMCGITSETQKNWGPVCKKTGRRVCDICCYNCEYHHSWSGIWRCKYITPEERRAAAVQRLRDREQAEILKATEVYKRRRREAAKQRAIRRARANTRKK